MCHARLDRTHRLNNQIFDLSPYFLRVKPLQLQILEYKRQISLVPDLSVLFVFILDVLAFIPFVDGVVGEMHEEVLQVL